MANKYVALIAGKLKEVIATVISTGVSEANKIVALDATGKLDVSVMPTGVGAEVVVAASSENLVAGDFVNLYDNAGTINVRKADATNTSKPCHGFVRANVTAPANATVYVLSAQNDVLTGLTVGADYYLSTTPGIATVTAPSAAGNIVQQLGKATSATNMLFTTDSNTVEIA